jgi:hypothetical protein
VIHQKGVRKKFSEATQKCEALGSNVARVGLCRIPRVYLPHGVGVPLHDGKAGPDPIMAIDDHSRFGGKKKKKCVLRWALAFGPENTQSSEIILLQWPGILHEVLKCLLDDGLVHRADVDREVVALLGPGSYLRLRDW